MAACIGLPAARSCEPRQTRKGAAVAMVAGAGARRVWAAAFKEIVEKLLRLVTLRKNPAQNAHLLTCKLRFFAGFFLV